MPSPLDLVLVRHGESEGNVASRYSKKGDHRFFTEEFKAKHSSKFRLTDRGVEQAKAAGKWIKDNFDKPYFDRYLASEHVRAMETAAHMGLPDADWQIDFFLREREWGDFDNKERDEEYFKVVEKKDSEPLYWTPPNGESLADLCSNRIKPVLASLARSYSDKSAILVCHGEVLWAFRILIERLRQSDFRDQYLSDEPECRMKNCQIFHYTRKDPKTGKASPYLHWVRTIDPTENEFTTEFREIEGKRYSDKELLEIVQKSKRIVNE